MTTDKITTTENFLIGLKLPQLEVYLIWNGGKYVEYQAYHNGALLFHGDDFKPSPLHAPDSLETIVDLLGFLTVRPGDTDASYFVKYTREQMEWAQGRDVEDVACLISDYEDKNSERHAVAKADLEVGLIIPGNPVFEVVGAFDDSDKVKSLRLSEFGDIDDDKAEGFLVEAEDITRLKEAGIGDVLVVGDLGGWIRVKRVS